MFVADRGIGRALGGFGRRGGDARGRAFHSRIDGSEEEQMKYPMMMAALLATGTALTAGAPVAVQAQDGCAVPKPQKKRGVGGLLSAARSGGLEGSVAGALRGDGDRGSGLEDSGRRTAAGDGAATGKCSQTPRGEDKGRPVGAVAVPETATERARREMAANDAKYPSRMPIPEDWKTAKTAYDAFGKVRCTSCEGGYAQAGWPDWPRDEYSGKYGGAETRLSRLPVGHVHRWSASGFSGTLTIDGEEQVNGFRCRKMTYRLEKGGQSVSRPGLMCWGKANEYAGSDSWVGVF
ncbi:hypothetical protein EAO27_14050 [Sphingopyxis sp. YF1]|nr:hypothetical protein EAO27_14050 [Sphingopyxis sp. YF1]